MQNKPMQTTQIIISIIILLGAIPLALLLSHLTRDEKEIYKKQIYFPTFLWIIAILSAVFYTLNIKIALSLSFVFILILTWYKSEKFKIS